MRSEKKTRKSTNGNTIQYFDTSSESESDTPKKKKQKTRGLVTSSPLSSKFTKDKGPNKKKMQTPKTLSQQMKPTSKELTFRKKKRETMKDFNDYSHEFVCTKCGYDYKSLIKNHSPLSCHPLMDVLLCPECCDYYGDGNFSLDSDDEDKYCRWCGEGGTIYTCSKCICGFCNRCIEKHFGKKAVKEVMEEDDWLCYFCNPEPLWHLRMVCSLAKEASSSRKKFNTPQTRKKTKEKDSVSEHKEDPMSSSESICIQNESEGEDPDEPKSKPDTRRRRSQKAKNMSCGLTSDEDMTKEEEEEKETGEADSGTDESRDLSFESRRPRILEKLENILKLTEHQMSFGMSWSAKKIKQLNDRSRLRTEKKLRNECQKAKWFISSLASYLVEFSNSLAFLEREITSEGSSKEKRESSPPPATSSYTGILKFLEFVTDQVHMFSKKGIELEDLLVSEIYEDDHTLGIRKKLEEEAKTDDLEANPVFQDSSSSDNGDKGKELLSPLQDAEIENIVTILKDS